MIKINDCGRTKYGNAYSIALKKDTLFVLTEKGNIYSQIVNRPNSCKLVATTYYTGNSMTIDENGMLYICSGQTLLRINSHNGASEKLGNIPFWSAGDLFFYKNKLYMAALEGIVQVNVSQPSKSLLYMRTSTYFFGIINVPDGCKNNKIYGIGSSIYELNMDAKTVGNPICMPPTTIFDAASITENGYTEGINIDEILINNICIPAASTGNITIKAGTATPGSTLIYSLNGTLSNQTGRFQNLSEGNYSINVRSTNGCATDTVIKIKKGLVPTISISTSPDTCRRSVGSLRIEPISTALPITYTLNNTQPQKTPIYNQLAAKQYRLRTTTTVGCYADTSFTIGSYAEPTPLQSTSITSEMCKPGSISLVYDDRVSGIQLNHVSVGQILTIPDLPAKVYTITLETKGCNYDTLLEVKKEIPLKPTIDIWADTPTCATKNDGAIRFNISGSNSPFALYSSDTLSAVAAFTTLKNGSYGFTIIDNAGCKWDTTVSINYTQKKPVTKINITDAACWAKPKGAISLSLSGRNEPYVFTFNNKNFASGDTIKNLYRGVYDLIVSDKNTCPTDTIKAIINKNDGPFQFTHIATTPSNCSDNTGTVTFIKNSNAGETYLSLEHQTFIDQLFFDKLNNGIHHFSIKDNNGCSADTAITIGVEQLQTPVKRITIIPEICEKKGAIAIELLPGKTITSVQLNNGLPQQNTLFTNLEKGLYQLSFIYNGCPFDTSATIEQTTTQKPSINITAKDVDCYDRNNGHISVNASNGSSPFIYSYNNSPFINDAKISSLAPGNYAISIKDSYGCIWDTMATINPFVIIKPSVNLITRTPICFVDERATLQVFINGPETPYRYSIGNALYNTGNEIKLLPGMYQTYINNKTGCVLDSAKIDLSYSQTGILPCDTIMVPNAFTPNGDMKNDYLRPVVNYGFVSDYSFSVFNRLGQLLFHTTEINKGWDGKINGQLQPQASYVWMVNYKTRAGKHVTQKGTAVLIR